MQGKVAVAFNSGAFDVPFVAVRAPIFRLARRPQSVASRTPLLSNSFIATTCSCYDLAFPAHPQTLLHSHYGSHMFVIDFIFLFLLLLLCARRPRFTFAVNATTFFIPKPISSAEQWSTHVGYAHIPKSGIIAACTGTTCLRSQSESFRPLTRLKGFTGCRLSGSKLA